MSIQKTIVQLWLWLVCATCTSVFGESEDIKVTASKDILPWPISVSVKTEFLPAKAGPAAFHLTVVPTEHFSETCDSIVISVKNLRGTPYIGSERWVVTLSEVTPYACLVNVKIPDNDTTAIEIGAGCTMTMDEARWFVTTGDTLEMYDQHPAGARKYRPSWSDLERAKFTPEQLQKEFDFFLDMRNCYRNCQAFVDSALGTLEPTDSAYVYRVRTTVDMWITLQCDWGLNITPVKREELKDVLPPQPDETPRRDGSESADSLGSQSLLENQDNGRGQGAISLERVTGLTGANTLPINETITYYIRMNNNTGTNIRGISNGFEVYSPDSETRQLCQSRQTRICRRRLRTTEPPRFSRRLFLLSQATWTCAFPLR